MDNPDAQELATQAYNEMLRHDYYEARRTHNEETYD